MLRAILLLLFLPPYIVVATVLGYPVARVLGSPALLYALGRIACRIGLFISGTRIVAEGAEILADPRNVVVMPNHSSHLDAPILLEVLKTDFKAVAKKEIFRIPFLNMCLRFAGFIEVDRENREQATQAMSRAVESLKAGSCFIVFPEGTRSRSGALGELKKGGFVIAMDAGSRIVPIAVKGVRELMPRGSFRLRPGTVHVRVLDPVDARSYSYDQRDALIACVRERLAAALDA